VLFSQEPREPDDTKRHKEDKVPSGKFQNIIGFFKNLEKKEKNEDT
jgi:hypothetical protein